MGTPLEVSEQTITKRKVLMEEFTSVTGEPNKKKTSCTWGNGTRWEVSSYSKGALEWKFSIKQEFSKLTTGKRSEGPEGTARVKAQVGNTAHVGRSEHLAEWRESISRGRQRADDERQAEASL